MKVGGKGGSKHLKRLPSPSFWPIHVKESKWITKPKAGPHSIKVAIPLSVVLREILGYAKTRRETKLIVSKGVVKVDGKTKRDHKYPIGLMDVLEITDAKSTFRMVPFKSKGLSLLKITKDEGKFKLCQINNKVFLNDEGIQLNFNDGRNVVLSKDSAQSVDSYNTRDSIKIEIPSQKILGHFKFIEGKYGLAVAGRNIGRHGKIVGIESATASKRATVSIQDQKGQTFRTVADYVFAIGDDEPEIKLPED
ncbi:MAG: 30S ribosomal protein S4e [Candidatus Bathyarchaeia archaeon]|jgi:small subunit ribosomal protein S4e